MEPGFGPGRGGTVKRRLGIAAAGLALLVSGVLVLASPSHAGRKPEISVVGDSITHAARAEVEQGFGQPDVLSLDAIPGRTIDDMRAAIRRAVAGHPRALVIELGTNDVREISQRRYPGSRTAKFLSHADDLHAALDDVAPARCVIWVDVPTVGGGRVVDLPVLAPAWNRLLVTSTAGHSNVHIADYAGPLEARGAKWLSANYDHPLLHPATPAARALVASVIVDATRHDCGV
jgi:hypothetical protein